MKNARRFRAVLHLGLVAICLCATATPGFAITDEDIYNQIRFNFISPGGRTLAMGGTAIAAVQDSTAAAANPGALVILARDEVFLEYRGTTFNEDNPSFETATIDVLNGSKTLDNSSATFLGYVHQWTTRAKNKPRFRQWALAFSRQEIANTERQVRNQEVRFDDPVGGGRFFTTTTGGDVDLEVVQYNLGFAGHVHPNWSVGVTGSWATMDLTSDALSTTRDPFNIFTEANPRERVDPETIQLETSVPGRSDEDVTFSVGIFWQPNTYYGDFKPPLRLGITYNRGPEFEVPIDVLDVDGNQLEERKFVLKVPDRLGGGFAYEMVGGAREQNLFTWAFDAVWVKYSDLLKGFETGLNTFTRFLPQEDVQLDFTIDDGVELKAGFEWSGQLSRAWTIALRAGAARLPANVIFADSVHAATPALEDGLRALYREGDVTNAYTTGLSFAFTSPGKINSYLDLGLQFSDESNQGVVSYILRF